MNQKDPKKALNRYVELSSKIRLLSSPEIGDIKGPDDYRNTLIANFTEIGRMAGEMNGLLHGSIYPLLEDDATLTAEEESLLNGLLKSLLNNTTMNHLDPMLCYRIANKLVEAAERNEDVGSLIRALDDAVDASYIMMRLALRLFPCSEDGRIYWENGLKASRRILEYLDRDAFASLPDEETREIVLVNSRYICAFEFYSAKMGYDRNVDILNRLEVSRALEDDPCYSEGAPNYNWRRHRFLTYQYALICTEMNNMCGLSEEELERSYQSLQKLKQLRESDEDYYSADCPASTFGLYEARINYLTGRSSAGEYKAALREVRDGADPFDYSVNGIIANIFVIEEYLLAVRQTEATNEDNDYLHSAYRSLTTYLHSMPKIEVISFGTNVVSDIIKDFVDVPGYTFTEFCMKLIAAIHPPTYVHTLTMSSLTSCLTTHLLRKHPELFMEFTGCSTPEKVATHEDEVLGYAERASLFHDIGKLFVMELIMMYGRDLDDVEFGLIRGHSEIGGYVLRQHEDSRPYQALVTAHHFNFDELDAKATEGLFEHAEIPFIAIAQCADGLDAGTDTVGRSYKKSGTLEEVLGEFKEGSGSRYAPYVVELFDDPKVISDIRKILKEERDDNYRKAYDTLLRLSDDRKKQRKGLSSESYGKEVESMMETILRKQQARDRSVFGDLKQLESRALAIGDDTLLGFACYHLADAYYNHESNYDLFRSYLVRAIKNLYNGNDDELLARAYNLLGVDACINGCLDVAYHYFSTVRRIASELLHSPLVGIADSNLGRVFYELGNYERALEHTKRSGKEMMPFKDDVNYYHNMADHFNDYGLVSLKLGDLKTARASISKIKEFERLARADGIDINHFQSASLEAQVAFEEGDMEEGIRIVSKTINLLSSKLYIIEYSEDLKDLCDCLLANGLDKYVAEILDKITVTMQDTAVDKLTGILCDLYISYYQKQGDKEKLLHYLLKKNSLTMRETERNKVYLNAVEMIDNMDELRKAHSRMQSENASLLAAASEDPLTGVANRYGMNRIMEDAFERASKAGAEICLMMIDIDHFKEYNDSYGHLKGDDCLKKVANIIRSVCNVHGAECARYGGDEFLLIIEEATPERVAGITEALDEAITKEAIPNLASRQGVVTLSHGSSSGIPDDVQDSWGFLHQADSDLYFSRETKRRHGLY